MHTNRSETRSVSIATTPDAVLDFLAEGRNLPRWAPRFAAAVRPAETPDGWLIDDGEREFPVTLRVGREHGTVDILRPGDTRLGAYLRVVPNAEGSECVFTLIFPHGVPEEAVSAQMETVEAELSAVRALVEA